MEGATKNRSRAKVRIASDFTILRVNLKYIRGITKEIKANGGGAETIIGEKVM